MPKNWKNIHPEFGKYRLRGEYLQYHWKNNGFDYNQTNAWIAADLRPWEYNIAWYLAKKEKQTPENLNRDNIASVKKEAEEKLKNEWKDFSTDEAIEWLKRNFSYKEVKQWIGKGLKTNEYEFADYLRKNSVPYTKELRNKYHQAQNWLDFNYPRTGRNEVKELVINNHNLEGTLKLENFPNLEELHCPDNKLISLEFHNCPQLKTILCSNNNLTNLILTNCPNITKLVGNKNQLTNLIFLSDLAPERLEMLNISSNNVAESNLTPFSKFTNLKHLGLGNWYKEIIEKEIYNQFTGSLEPLKNLTKLEELDLAGTDVDSGWEYLPESLQIFYLFAKEKPESKSSLIGEELKKYGEPGKDKDEDDDFALLLRKFKQVQTLQKFEEQETEIKYLELRIQELTNLIKNQKQKIINDFLNVLPEKGLIQQLITTYLELKKTEKQKLPSRKLEKECNKFKDELEDRLGEEFVEKMQFILSDCEELVSWELELEERLRGKVLLIEEQRKCLQITGSSEKKENLAWKEKTQQNQIAEFEKLKQENLSLQLEELVRNQGRLIAEQVINKIEEINEDNEKMFSSTEEPIFDEKDKIGEGGHGVVYRGKHKKRDAAVKKLILTNDAKRQEIRNEINILKKLRDRNIIQYYGVYYRDKQILIIMDYAEGGSLKKLIDDNKNRGHDWNFNTKIIKQVTSGLAYIHHENILHCDLKSLNVLMTTGNQAKISDFGLSRIKNISPLQIEGVKGSLRWMAPEVLEDKEFSKQSDIYSLGMVIWEIAAKCTTPFAKINGWDLVLHIIKKEKETISNGTPQNIRNIIEGCWKNKPNERISLENILKMIEKEDILRKAIREKEKQLDELINEESEYSKALLEPLIKAQNQEEFQQGKDNLKGKSQEFENIFQIKEEIIELKKQLGDIKANDEKFQDAKLSPQLIHTTSGILGSQIKEEKNNYSTILTPENTSKVCIIDWDREQQFHTQVEVPPKNN